MTLLSPQDAAFSSGLNRGFRLLSMAAAFVLLSGCSGANSGPTLPPKTAKALEKTATQLKEEEEKAAAEREASLSDHKGPKLPWAPSTFSPRPGSTPEPTLEATESACGEGDSALHEVAELLAGLHHESGEVPNLDVAKFHLRRRGAPYVMPRLWSATMRGVSEEAIAESVKEWAQSRPALGVHRCGVGLKTGDDGSMTVSVLQVDVLVEVKPVPTELESGTWVDLEVQFMTSTTDATVLLLPPEGRPRSLNTRMKGRKAHARFSIETEGTWLIQVMATQTGGPRPVAQMLVTSDRSPPQGTDTRPVPGEESFDKQARPADALFGLMNAAREDQGLPLLKRNRTLDRVALEHSRHMMKKGRISHDTGHGNPAERVEQAGMDPKATGENVALAGTVIRLHRVLWASPSHRENLLLRRWDEAGVAIVEGENGTLFATQLFADDD